MALPASEVADWQDQRHRAAIKVQAHWRGLVQRRKLAMKSPEEIRRQQVLHRCLGAVHELLQGSVH